MFAFVRSRAATLLSAALALSLLLLGSAQAQNQAQTAPEDTAPIFAAARAAALGDGATVPLGDQAQLKLPPGKIFIPQPHAAQVMRAMGNPGDYKDLLGLVFPDDGEGWFAVLRFEASGYVKDNDAKDWNADELLDSYRQGTEASNTERKKMGVPELDIVGWAEKPSYNTGAHQLVWAMSSKSRGAPADEEQGVNYNTYALGREGYVSLNLVTDLKDLPQHKGEAQALLNALAFSEGKRYADFNAGTDKVAEYGLAALVLGVGAKKLGLFAVVFAFLAKFAKVIALAVFAFGGALLKFFKRKPAENGPTDAIGAIDATGPASAAAEPGTSSAPLSPEAPSAPAPLVQAPAEPSAAPTSHSAFADTAPAPRPAAAATATPGELSLDLALDLALDLKPSAPPATTPPELDMSTVAAAAASSTHASTEPPTLHQAPPTQTPRTE